MANVTSKAINYEPTNKANWKSTVSFVQSEAELQKTA